MNSKHTPGPWTVGPTDRSARYAATIPDGLTRLCSVDGIAIYCKRDTLCDDPADDARAIAAVPNLIAACKAALPLAWEVGCETEDGVHTLLDDSRGDLYRQLSAALAKAGL